MKKSVKHEQAETKERRQQELENAMENFNRKEIPQTKKKNKWLGPVVLLFAIGIGVYLIIKMSADIGEEQKSFREVFSSVLPVNAFWAVLTLLGIVFLDMAKFSIIMHATTNKVHPLIGAKTSLLGKYYDNITPFSSGGQPMQIYYLYKKGFSGGLSSAVVMIKYAFNTTAWLLVAFVCMVFNSGILQGVENGNVLLVAGWIGWALNSLLPIFLLTFVLMPKMARKLTHGVVHLGYKMKIVKDEEKLMARAEGVVRDFRSAFVIMSKHPVHMALIALACIWELSLTFALPYFIIKMFNGFAVDEGFATMFSVMALNAFATFSASVVPTPGNSGALEGLLTMAFSSIAGSTLMWVIFTWRFAVFYLYIIIGVGISVFNFVRNLIRERRKTQFVATDANGCSVQPNNSESRAVAIIQSNEERIDKND